MVAQKIVIHRIDSEGESNAVVLNGLQKGDILKHLALVCSNPEKYSMAIEQESVDEHKPSPSDYWTLSEYLDAIGLEVSVRDRQRINYYLTNLYKQHYGKPSRVVYRSNPGDRRKSIKLSGYAPKELWVIKDAIKQAMGLEIILEKGKEPQLVPVVSDESSKRQGKRPLPVECYQNL